MHRRRDVLTLGVALEIGLLEGTISVSSKIVDCKFLLGVQHLLRCKDWSVLQAQLAKDEAEIFLHLALQIANARYLELADILNSFELRMRQATDPLEVLEVLMIVEDGCNAPHIP
jgi:hypothetical protein